MSSDGNTSSAAAVLATATPTPKQPVLDESALLSLWPFLRPHLVYLGIALALLPVSSLAALWQPYFIKRAIDAVVLDAPRAALTLALAGYALVLALDFASRVVLMICMQLGGQRAVADVRMALFQKLQRAKLQYFDRTPSGVTVTRLTNDVDSLSEFFASGSVTAIADLLTLVGILIFMFYLDAELAALSLLVFPPLVLILRSIRSRARDAFREIRRRVAWLNGYLAEQVYGIETVIAAGKEQHCQAVYAERNDAYRDANFRAIRYDALLYSVVESISALGVAAVIGYASIRLGFGTKTQDNPALYIGTVVAFYEYIQRFFVPIRDLSQKLTVVQSAVAASERIVALLAEPEEIEGNEPRDVAQNEQRASSLQAIAFARVCFGYDASHPVVKNIDFCIQHGEKVAFVGASGAGKTTLTALLLRLYPVQSGSILFKGKPVQHWSLHELRSQFSVVTQDAYFGTGTLYASVGLGTELPAETVQEALQKVGMWPRLVARGIDLHAPIQEQARNFSAGERQLLAMARALLLDRPFLIFDEATSQIDPETELRVQQAATLAMQGRTAIVIAHRLSTIRHVDRIYVMRQGEIIEQGSHDTLLAQSGYYARLHALQQNGLA